ncbi:MAG: 30S ribosomal protein S20 [Deltaproteobacteria bacterium]|nr:MAG: 30S ribosomal protein S20 [Deltaproteobacteria bacterium]
MPNHKSALKRMRQNEKRRLRNKSYKTRVKNIIKKVKFFVEKKDIENATKTLSEAVSLIQKVAGKGIIHKNNASRKISKLTRLVNNLRAELENKPI